MKKKLALVWKNFSTSGFKGELEPKIYTRLVFLNSGTLLGLIVLSYYLAKDIPAGSGQAIPEAIVFFVFIFNLVFLRITKKLDWIINLTLLAVLINFLSFIFTGGSDNTGLYWFAVFPVSAFFLKGRKGGLFWSFVLIILSWAIVHIGKIGYYETAFGYFELSTALISLGVVSILMFFYETISERYDNLIEEQKQSLQESNQMLQSEIRSREQIENKLAISIEKSEEQNKSLQETTRAMINVLEDQKELEKQLKIEKANVEQKVDERTAELRAEKEELAVANKTIEASIIEVEKEKSRLDASISGLPIGFMMTDNNGFIVAMNRSAKNIFDQFKQILELEDLEDIVKESFSLKKLEKDSHRNKIPQEIHEVKFGKKILNVFVSPILVETNIEESLGTVFLIEDVTERVVVSRSKDEFFSIASHELRTPLTAIRSYAVLIKQLYSPKIKDKKFDEMTNDIHDSSLRLIEIVNDFLDTSKLEQGKMTIKKEKVDLKQTVNQVIENLQPVAGQNKVYLKNNLKSALVVNADSEKVKQVLVNLLGNSLKFTTKGGVIISAKKIGDFAEVSVLDTGKGISLQNQKLLFRKFQQAEDNILTRDSNRATGLGLYICKLLVEKMGGEIWMDKSSLGKGTTFKFTLPIKS